MGGGQECWDDRERKKKGVWGRKIEMGERRKRDQRVMNTITIRLHCISQSSTNIAGNRHVFPGDRTMAAAATAQNCDSCIDSGQGRKPAPAVRWPSSDSPPCLGD